ncbi:Tigr01456 family had hydrolase, partial [Globisporangium splendens]
MLPSLLRRSLSIAPAARRSLLQHATRAFSSSSSSSSKSTFGVVFDVDGVLLRGKTPIPGAKEVLLDLRANDIPFAILTNGGGYPEAKKAQQISQILGVELAPEFTCLSHTPMRTLADKHRDDLVLAVGKDCDEVSAIMANYGFKNVVTVGQLHNHFPTMYPDIKVQGDVPHGGRFEKQQFGAVFVLIDPIYWGRELQIVMDVLCSQEGLLHQDGGKQHVPLYSACSDFQYVGEYNLPRYGAGAFRAVMEDLYFRTTGHHLEQMLFGKPEITSFAYAEKLIDAQHANVKRIYMVGDNPTTDIKGANNAGGRWKSLLTLTGMHVGPDNHDEYPAYQVVDDVAQALAFMKEDFAKANL